jgi:hypothetical protein
MKWIKKRIKQWIVAIVVDDLRRKGLISQAIRAEIRAEIELRLRGQRQKT